MLTHKDLAVKRKYIPRPRGSAFSLTPFSPRHSGGGADTTSATRLSYRRQTRLLAPLAADEPHPTLIRTPAARPRRAGRLCRGTEPRPVPILVRSQLRGQSKASGSPPRREGPVRPGSRAGRVVRRSLLRLRGGRPPRLGKSGAAVVPSKRQAAGAAAQDTSADSWSTDGRVSSSGLAPQAPVRRRLAGRPVAQCLTKRLISKTSLVWSMW
jgi:hypothetical protein